MTALLYIIPVLIFGLILLIVFGIWWYLSSLKSRRDLLKKIADTGKEQSSPEPAPEGNVIHRFFLSITQRLGSLGKPKSEEEISYLKRRFLQAGLGRFSNVTLSFYGARLFFAILLPVLFLIFKVSLLRPMLPVQIIFVLVVLALIGFYIPSLWLRIKIAGRKDEIVRGFPDALDLMVVCAEAGMGLDAAINRVGDEMKIRCPEVSEELRLLSLELRAGKQRRDALRNLTMRTDSEDINSFVTLLVQTDKFGTSIAQALRVQADSMRTKRTQKVEELAAKLPVKLLFPTILFIFPSLFLVLIGPALIRAFRVWKGF
jgi:tight adherence protein C